MPDNGSIFVGDKGKIMCGLYGEGARIIPETKMQEYAKKERLRRSSESKVLMSRTGLMHARAAILHVPTSSIQGRLRRWLLWVIL
jgi:hypothetical protein